MKSGLFVTFLESSLCNLTITVPYNVSYYSGYSVNENEIKIKIKIHIVGHIF